MANMFGALNRFISRLDAGDAPAGQRQSGGSSGAFGFQVLRNTNKDLNLEPWFDFIIGINGRNLESADPQLFAQEVGNCKGASVSLGIWNAKGSRVRETYATVPQDSQLGLSLQWAPVALTEDVWHILDVAPNSPADTAGLLPYGDYIIGSPDGLLKGEAGLGELVEDYLTRPLRLWVYNHEYDVTRLITIQPSRNWGGSGALGCVLGYGALHRIPASLEEPPNAPGETLFESARLSTDSDTQGFTPSTPPAPQYIVPADMAPQRQDGAAKPPPPQAGGAKRERKHHGGKGMDMDAFFAEGEAKSREQDYTSSPKPSGSGLAPPPPKGGAPPRASSPLRESSTADSDAGEK